MSSDKQRVALISLAASAGLAAAKLVAGLVTGSLGLISEAIHSGLDFIATAITWLAVRFADRPADDTHHFGHAKAEALSALLTTALLAMTVAWVIWEAVSRLLGPGHEISVPWWAPAILVVSIVVDFNRSRALGRAAEEHGSQALAADALHFSADMLSSAAALAGLAAVWLGWVRGDALAALAVAGFIAHASWQLGNRTVATLLDAAPEGLADTVRRAAAQTPGVLEISRLRVSPKGKGQYVDLDFTVRRTLGIDAVDRIKANMTRNIRAAAPDTDISLTALPVTLDDETVHDKVYLLARRNGLAVHHVTIQQLGDRLAVSFDLEVDRAMPLGEAHAIATRLEDSIEAELGGDVEVESHIEPLASEPLEGDNASPATTGEVRDCLTSLLGKARLAIYDIHDVRVRETDAGRFVTYHCRADADLSVEAVHEAVDTLDRALRKAMPSVRRVIAHAEPHRH